MGVLPVNMSVYHLFFWSLQRSEEGIRFFGIAFTDNCESPDRLWDSNPGSPEEQLIFLTVELSLWPLIQGFKILCGQF